VAFSVLLVGAGHLGSRYLQGIVRSSARLNITVVDPSVSALETARLRWIEAGGDQCQHEVRWSRSVPSGLKCIDLALIVTSAKGRAALVDQIAAQITIRFWVMEKVLVQSVAELEVIKRATNQSKWAWVNTARRMMVWHQSLEKVFASHGPIKSTYSGGLWGLTCNSIHFLDLISWWTGEKLESVDIRGLDSFWFESNRTGYFEVTGELIGKYSCGTTLMLRSRDTAKTHPLLVDFAGGPVWRAAKTQPLRVDLADGTVWEIDEANGRAISSKGEKIHGRFDLQSELSARLVDDILLRGQCDLPTLEESAAMHSVFLDAMLKHWNLSQNRNDRHVPIT
jgi:hypothetical protein